MKQLLIGCGNQRQRLIRPTKPESGFNDLVTLDIDPNSGADVLHDLDSPRLPFDNDSFDEIHAYEVLEHVGRQGDWRGFFREFNEYWRVLKHKGFLCGTVPAPGSKWVWGDPGHTRAISLENFVFLDRSEYAKQVGKTSMTDYRHVYSGDLKLVFAKEQDGTLAFALQALKG